MRFRDGFLAIVGSLLVVFVVIVAYEAYLAVSIRNTQTFTASYGGEELRPVRYGKLPPKETDGGIMVMMGACSTGYSLPATIARVADND